ncbi:MAG: cytochrome c biogenesis protein CcsA [Bacteroidales bacterium]|nr:cytochrome c biogenesis protein CcsA [Bacteroidales bacterium]
MTWSDFIYFALPSVLLWIGGALASFRQRRALALGFSAIGLVVFSAFIALLWTSLERPPLRTMGETRLWYSAFLSLAGIVIYSRWRYRWVLSFSTVLSIVFICVNIFKPEIHNKTLMPALQSPWFAPHVIIYMFCYALFGVATLIAIYTLVKRGTLEAADNMVYVGLSMMTVAMLFGALWAKEAWGHYWAWDPKETWAAATWLLYLSYIHQRLARPKQTRIAAWLLIVCFCCLQMCWWGINYLPTAQGNSVHTYNIN